MGSQRSQGFAFGWDVSCHAARLTALLCGLVVMTAARAADVPEDGLLEFLGSVDTEDKAWHDYLARTDIDQVARRGRKASGDSAPPVPSSPPRAPDADPPTPASPAPDPASSAPASPPSRSSPPSPPVSAAPPPAGGIRQAMSP